MADLGATQAVTGLPLTIGQTRLELLDPGPVTAIAPYPGADVSAALAPLGLAFPSSGAIAAGGAARLIWAGRELAFLLGVEPPAALATEAAVTDQTDGWAWLHLAGRDARAVLARLTPLDLRDTGLATGTSARSTIGHMQAIVIRPAPEAYELAVFRSMAGTLVHDVTEAMRRVAARAAL